MQLPAATNKTRADSTTQFYQEHSCNNQQGTREHHSYFHAGTGPCDECLLRRPTEHKAGRPESNNHNGFVGCNIAQLGGPLHLGDKNGFTLYLAILGLKLLNQRHAVSLLLFALLLQIFAGNFVLGLIALFGGPANKGGVMR